ncbi:MAG: DNA translocase FtsK [Cytophagales bacterium]|nr:DNA translocase FtsK [Cytophagales bacterium]MDW8385213.1 DNA translocase FtsK [Flammeovirgaceae bacterium]
MATKRNNTYKTSGSATQTPSLKSEQKLLLKLPQKVYGIVVLSVCIALFLSFVSFLANGTADQNIVESLFSTNPIVQGIESRNWVGLLGAIIGYIFVYRGFGIASFLGLIPLFALGWLWYKKELILDIRRTSKIVFFLMFWISLTLGYLVFLFDINGWLSFVCGGIGYTVSSLFHSFFGIGTLIIIVVSFWIFALYYMQDINLKNAKSFIKQQISDDVEHQAEHFKHKMNEDIVQTAAASSEKTDISSSLPTVSQPVEQKELENTQSFTITNVSSIQEVDLSPTEAVATDNLQETISDANSKDPVLAEVEDFDRYDPTLELSKYEYPPLDLLRDIGDQRIEISEDELISNINRIVSILESFKVQVQKEKTRVTVGPTVTLYEVVPAPGVKVAQVKSREDDIALNLKALGIRIIAPIPGAGTIGIEVPNKNPKIVSIRSVLASDKFIHTDKELPIAFGRTISNEVFVADLTKMPHLLIAGATGQGKSVGINTILASLLFKKHPAHLKFVMIDPKQVELALYNQIERHFLAALPDADEPVITDVSKAKGVLSSLCVEMDLRYSLLKDAGVRNIKEYNEKFINRRLNPHLGHRFLPYIVLVIDELADLMMTAGKEIEYYIARLAQKARAIGIHLIVATQRPSVDVITGMIKANFPARLSFRVMQKVDSRTILDANGAEQLIGKGDMLLTNGSDIIRLQCAYIDTQEVENLCKFIGSQRGYPTSYLLPEPETDSQEEREAFDWNDLDSMFEEAARLIVSTQQGSTSLLQRKLSLGYARAGRVMDQLEAAGIVGKLNGSKPREVLITDTSQLEMLLARIRNK